MTSAVWADRTGTVEIKAAKVKASPLTSRLPGHPAVRRSFETGADIRNGLIFIELGIAKQPNMKKYFTIVFVGLFLTLSSSTFAQVDSSRIASAQRQIAKDQKKADKLAKRANRQERKQKHHEKKMERKERKRQRTLNGIQKNERKLENMRKDTTRNSAFLSPAGVLPLNRDAVAFSRKFIKVEAWKSHA